MMKKWFAVLLAAVLCVGLTAASAETYAAGSYYTIDIPSDMDIDDSSYTDENTDSSQWLFLADNDSFSVDAYLNTTEEFAGLSLYSATDDEKQAYVDSTLEQFADYECKLVDTLTVAERVPFYVYSLSDDEGTYYYAETIAAGNSINFDCYYNSDMEPDDALLKALEDMLMTFQPAQ